MNKLVRPVASVVLLALSLHASAAGPTSRPSVFKSRVMAHWTDASHFWYRNDLPGGRHEIVTIDVNGGTRTVRPDGDDPAATPPATRPTRSPASMPRPVDIDEWSAPAGPITTPDGKHTVVLKDNNVCIGTTAAEAKPVTTDGTADFPYDRVFLSPDGRSVVTYRVQRGDHKTVYRVESSPPDAKGFSSGGAGRAILHEDEYMLPGDKTDSFELNLIDVATGKQIKPAAERIDADKYDSHPSPRPRWRPDGHRFTYEKYDRGHQRLRLIEVDAVTGEVRTPLEETSKTFIWTGHTDDLKLRLFNYLPDGREVIYVSERSGWRQLYLLDLDTASLKPITSGEWVLRGIVKIDADKRQILFTAGGVYPGQDPYYLHLGRVNFDGTGLTWLTDANGEHDIDYRRPQRIFSPDGRFIVVTHSRIDSPPVTELRRTDDGKKVMDLETAVVTGTPHPPEPFVAKGRDGKTDIYGVICRPTNFDPNKKYPILEDIYPGPTGYFTPKTYMPIAWWQRLADKGFIIVKADGMGTAMRSKAFHDVCWHNLNDAGFPDRIAWIKAAAAKYPYMDIDRVGIFGTSAGGQAAMSAMLFHNDFYKAAVANCGCHDNRMDKISWNEQWMGWPVGPQYSENSNIDNAAKLKGRLQIVLGEMDSNVPVESTYRLVNALVQNGKEFEFVLIPNANHGAASPITERKLSDFFVRYLQGVEPANPN